MESDIFLEIKVNKVNKIENKYITEKEKHTCQTIKYKIVHFLGRGGFSECYQVINMNTNKIFAAKIITKISLYETELKQKLLSEIKIHKRLQHNNIVKFEHFFEDKENVYILLENCQNQTLHELIERRKRLTELEVQYYAYQIIKGLKYLHSHRIIHRDLKLRNLFLSDKMELKIGDFGLSARLESCEERRHTYCGTPEYIAPEILEGNDSGYSFEVDIWSLGVIIYTLVVGETPFIEKNLNKMNDKIKTGLFSFPDNIKVSAPCKALISDILTKDPVDRPSLDNILASEFFKLSIAIPDQLPPSTIACPPTLEYIKSFMPNAGSEGAIVNIAKNLKVEQKVQQQKNNHFKSKITLQKGKTFSEEFESRNIRTPFAYDIKTTMAKFKSNKNNLLTYKDNSAKNILSSTIDTKEFQDVNTNSQKNPEVINTNNIIIQKWLDSSLGEGFGYLLSNGYIGVIFKDSSSIVQDLKTHTVFYIEPKQFNGADRITKYSHLNYPKELRLKVLLTQSFKNYFEIKEEINKNYFFKTLAFNEFKSGKEGKNLTEFVYLRNWLVKKRALVFRLSNKFVQVCFNDKTQILLSGDNMTLTYIDKGNERFTCLINDVFNELNEEIAQKVSYSKKILKSLLKLK
jgi:polo-like kinase 1